MRHIGVVTTSRADYGLYRPILARLAASQSLSESIYVSGTHLLPKFGNTVDDIVADDFRITARIPTIEDGDEAVDVAAAIATGVRGFAELFADCPPDILLVLGDRFEMFAAVVAAVPFNLPIAHIHGGEVTEGAIDEAFRHATSKAAHLHFVATEVYGGRLRQMGEEPWRITVSGAPGLDNLATLAVADWNELCGAYGLDPSARPLLVTFHPVTLEASDTGRQIVALLEALDTCPLPIVFTAPNADTGGAVIREALSAFTSRREDAVLVENLGTVRYFAMMRHAAAMVGNSSSGIIEAASFGLPVVNVGSRQAGRVRARNVIDVLCEADAIAAGISQATSAAFRESLIGLENPYGDGKASARIVDVLDACEIGERLLKKRFVDIAPTEGAVH